MNKLNKNLPAALVLGTCFFATSCIGPNNAYNSLAAWNSKLSDSKFVNELAFLGLTIVPVYLLFKSLGWLDTYRPLIVPSWFGGNAFYIFLLRQFFQTIPTDLDDAPVCPGARIRSW